MKIPSIPRDDILDVMEMTQKLERRISKVLEGNEHTLAMSALMSASINCMFSQCKTLNEVLNYRDAFVRILDASIREVDIKGSERPPLS